MKKLLLSCDQVFDVLTRGPFPSGEPTDESVEHHLRACHECRQLAEALRPAVAVLHEAVAADQALGLPGYQGSLPQEIVQPRQLSFAKLTGAPRSILESDAPATAVRERRASPSSQARNYVRLIAASVLIIGLTASLWSLGSGAKTAGPVSIFPAWLAAQSTAVGTPAEGIPTEAGLLTLASLRLPVTCVPLTHQPISKEIAAELALAMMDGSLAKLRCCTECHHAGGTPAAARFGRYRSHLAAQLPGVSPGIKWRHLHR